MLLWSLLFDLVFDQNLPTLLDILLGLEACLSHEITLDNSPSLERYVILEFEGSEPGRFISRRGGSLGARRFPL